MAGGGAYTLKDPHERLYLKGMVGVSCSGDIQGADNRLVMAPFLADELTEPSSDEVSGSNDGTMSRGVALSCCSNFN